MARPEVHGMETELGTETTDAESLPATAGAADAMRERSRELQERGLWYHVILFIGGTMLLVSANLILTPAFFWVIPIVILWAFFLMWHAWQIFGNGQI
jgi:hypothetical protein